MAFATPDDLAVRLGITFTDTQLAQVEALLDDASASITTYTGQAITETVYTDVRVRVQGNLVRLPQRPVQSIEAVVDSNGNTASYTWRGFDTFTIGYIDRFDYEPYWCGEPYVVVDYTAGYDPVPDVIVGICCQIAGRALGSPSNEAGITQESLGAYSYSRGAIAGAGPFGLMEQEKAILDHFCLVGGNAYILR